MHNHTTEIVPLLFPLISRLLKQRQEDLVNYLWEEDIKNAIKARKDIETFKFKLERGDIYDVPF